jgi:Polymorphic toxin system, DSP-PTPase phosphatase
MLCPYALPAAPGNVEAGRVRPSDELYSRWNGSIRSPLTSMMRPDTYWLDHGWVMAGEYPSHRDGVDVSRARLAWLADSGVQAFVDLTQEGEYSLPAYSPLLEGATYLRFPISDLSVPTREGMSEILDAIDAHVDAGEPVYVHCYAGIGRTGTVAGCYLVRHGLSGRQALARLVDLRRRTLKGRQESPQTAEQRSLVSSWQPTW